MGFGECGFPESHAASFALLVYVSAWLKHHETAAFFAALINSQPMGFYAPAQLIREARRVGVEVRPVTVTESGWDCSLERGHPAPAQNPALHLGLRRVKGLSRAGAAPQPAALPPLPVPTEGVEIVADYGSLGLSLRRHPLALLRERLRQQRLCTAAEVGEVPPGARVTTAGLVINHQRPGSANEVTFVTLDDETGQVNLIVWKRRTGDARLLLYLLARCVKGAVRYIIPRGSAIRVPALADDVGAWPADAHRRNGEQLRPPIWH